MECLFCNSNGPYSTVEHIIPESLGNKHILLEKQICDSCQKYFGTKVEEYVLRRSPIGWWRVHAQIYTKKGKNPKFSFTQPNEKKGILEDYHPANDNGVSFHISNKGERLFSVSNDEMLMRMHDGEKKHFKLVLTPKMLHMMSRFLGKVGLEMLARDFPEEARSRRFDELRNFVRYGQPPGYLWPIFYLEPVVSPNIQTTEIVLFDTDGLIKGGAKYMLSCLTLGSETWIICLNDAHPHPVIRNSFPGRRLELITY